MSPPQATSYLWKPSHSCLQRLWRLVNPSRWTLVLVPRGEGAREGGQSLGGLFVEWVSLHFGSSQSLRDRQKTAAPSGVQQTCFGSKVAPAWMSIACRHSGSMHQGPTCKRGLHYLVPGSYLFLSSFHETLKVFSLEEKTTSWNGQEMHFLKWSMKN